MQTAWCKRCKSTWVLVADADSIALPSLPPLVPEPTATNDSAFANSATSGSAAHSTPPGVDLTGVDPTGGSAVPGEIIVCNAEVWAHPVTLHPHNDDGDGRSGTAWLISAVFTEPHWRGRGYATAMINQLLATAAATPGVVAAELFSDIGVFYSRMGFVPAIAPPAQPLDVVFPPAARESGSDDLTNVRWLRGFDSVPSPADVADDDAFKRALSSAVPVGSTRMLTVPGRDRLMWHIEFSEMYCNAFGISYDGIYGAELVALEPAAKGGAGDAAAFPGTTADDGGQPSSGACISRPAVDGSGTSRGGTTAAAAAATAATAATAEIVAVAASDVGCGQPKRSKRASPFIVVCPDPWTDRSVPDAPTELLILWLHATEPQDCIQLVRAAQVVARDAGLHGVRMWHDACLPCDQIVAGIAGARVEPRDGALPMCCDLRPMKAAAAGRAELDAAAAAPVGATAGRWIEKMEWTCIQRGLWN